MFLIGVCGGPSCGKTTLVEYIKISLRKQITVIKCSDFYIPLLGKTRSERSSSYEKELEIIETNQTEDGSKVTPL